MDKSLEEIEAQQRRLLDGMNGDLLKAAEAKLPPGYRIVREDVLEKVGDALNHGAFSAITDEFGITAAMYARDHDWLLPGTTFIGERTHLAIKGIEAFKELLTGQSCPTTKSEDQS